MRASLLPPHVCLQFPLRQHFSLRLIFRLVRFSSSESQGGAPLVFDLAGRLEFGPVARNNAPGNASLTHSSSHGASVGAADILEIPTNNG